jgi:O-antigen ligase
MKVRIPGFAGLGWYDLTGLLVVAALGTWAAISAAVNGANPGPQLALLLAASAAYVTGRITHRVQFGAAIVTAVLLTAAVVAVPETFHGPPRNTPLDYENADAAWFAQGTAAAVLLALSARSRVVRRLAWLGGAFLVAVAAGLASVTGAGLAAVVLVTGVVAHRVRPRRAAAAAASIALAAVGTTVLLAATPESAATRAAERALTERRIVLWQEALELTAEQPVVGVGPGRFAVEAPTARRSPATRLAHSAYLQQSAETGLPGAVLLGGLVAWSYGALRRSERDTAVVAVGVAALTALSIHAAIDYVVHFPAVVLTAAFLVGLTTVAPRVRRPGPT